MKQRDWAWLIVIGAGAYLLARKGFGGGGDGATLKDQMQNLPFTPVEERPNVLVKSMTLGQLPFPPPGSAARSVTPSSVHPRRSVLYGWPLKGDHAKPAISPWSVMWNREKEQYL
jgi:hypothetical protein